MKKITKKQLENMSVTMEDVQKIKNGQWLFQWCCDCNLRHIWNFEIIRGKEPKDDYITARSTRDSFATQMRRKLKI